MTWQGPDSHHPDVATGILEAGGKRLCRLGWLNLCDRSHCLLADTLGPVLDGLKQGPSRGPGRSTELAKRQGGAELDPVAVIFKQQAAQAVDDLRHCAGKLGQNPGHLNFHLIVRVVEEENQGVQVRCAWLAPLAHRLDGGGSNQRVRVSKRGRDHPCCLCSRQANCTQGANRLATYATIVVARCLFERGTGVGRDFPNLAERLGGVSA